MLNVTVYWQVYEQTQSAKLIGYLGLTEAVPNILIALFSGLIADKYNRKKIIVGGLFVVWLCVFSLFIISKFPSLIHADYGLAAVFFLVFITGSARGFLQPALFGIQAQLVSRDEYTQASTWTSTNWHTAAIAGPAVGGLVYASVGLTNCYGVIVSIMLCGLLILLAMKPEAQTKIQALGESTLDSILLGLRFVFKNQFLLGAMALDMFAVLFGGVVAILPFFADNLQLGAAGLGYLRAAPAVGAVLAAIILIYKPIRGKIGMTMLISVAIFGLCMIGFAFSHNFYLSLSLLALSGAVDNVSVVIRSSIMQLETPDSIRGRVSAVSSIFVGSSNEIGAFESGIAADAMGVVPSVVFGGVMTLIVVGLTGISAPLLRNMKLEVLERRNSIRH